jgi:hypothetical protein
MLIVCIRNPSSVYAGLKRSLLEIRSKRFARVEQEAIASGTFQACGTSENKRGMLSMREGFDFPRPSASNTMRPLPDWKDFQ